MSLPVVRRFVKRVEEKVLGMEVRSTHPAVASRLQGRGWA